MEDEVHVAPLAIDPAAGIRPREGEGPEGGIGCLGQHVEEPSDKVAVEQLALAIHEPTEWVALDAASDLFEVVRHSAIRLSRAVRMAAGAGGIDGRADMITARNRGGPDAAGGETACRRVRQRLSRNEWAYAGKRALDNAFLLPGDPGICRLWRPGLRLCIRCSAL